MVKFLIAGDKDGKKINVVGLGITARNVELLAQGKPMPIKLSELLGKRSVEFLGPDDEIFLFYGKTEVEIMKELKKAGVNIPPSAP